jgi:hypothetical protein
VLLFHRIHRPFPADKSALASAMVSVHAILDDMFPDEDWRPVTERIGVYHKPTYKRNFLIALARALAGAPKTGGASISCRAAAAQASRSSSRFS